MSRLRAILRGSQRAGSSLMPTPSLIRRVAGKAPLREGYRYRHRARTRRRSRAARLRRRPGRAQAGGLGALVGGERRGAVGGGASARVGRDRARRRRRGGLPPAPRGVLGRGRRARAARGRGADEPVVGADPAGDDRRGAGRGGAGAARAGGLFAGADADAARDDPAAPGALRRVAGGLPERVERLATRRRRAVGGPPALQPRRAARAPRRVEPPPKPTCCGPRSCTLRSARRSPRPRSATTSAGSPRAVETCPRRWRCTTASKPSTARKGCRWRCC